MLTRHNWQCSELDGSFSFRRTLLRRATSLTGPFESYRFFRMKSSSQN